MNFKDLRKGLLSAEKKLEFIGYHFIYARQFKKYLIINNLPNTKQDGEELYVKKWKSFSSRIEPYSYRLFSHYCGQTANIIPEDIGLTRIEYKLNPLKYQAYYEDKNLYRQYIDIKYLPKTYVCRINGSCLLDGNYKPINDNIENALSSITRVVLKPTMDSCSGHGVMVFEKKNNIWISEATKVILTQDYLEKYGNDFVVQDAITQHEYIAQFNKSSVNTIRIGTYRSVKNEEVHILGSLIRIGRGGEFLDNAHAGGKFVGIEPKSGKLNSYACDQYGRKSKEWNGIDFSQNTFYIPEWKKIIDFAKYIGEQVKHCRLLALDICLDADGNPKLIEYNVSRYSFWLYMFSGQNALGDFTDEIIDFCSK